MCRCLTLHDDALGVQSMFRQLRLASNVAGHVAFISFYAETVQILRKVLLAGIDQTWCHIMSIKYLQVEAGLEPYVWGTGPKRRKSLFKISYGLIRMDIFEKTLLFRKKR